MSLSHFRFQFSAAKTVLLRYEISFPLRELSNAAIPNCASERGGSAGEEQRYEASSRSFFKVGVRERERGVSAPERREMALEIFRMHKSHVGRESVSEDGGWRQWAIF